MHFFNLMLTKNYLQSTMTKERLNHVMLLHTYKDCIDNINLLEIAKEFNDRRINLFGHF